MIASIVIGFSAVLSTLVLTPVVQAIGVLLNCIDHPNERKIHQRPIVRIGGVAIFLSTFLILLVWKTFVGINSSLEFWQIWGLLIGAVGFFCVGIIDDLFDLSPLPRLIAQTILSSVAWCFEIRVEYLPIPFAEPYALGWLSLPVTLVWIVGLTNAINWLDGLDGLAAGIGAIASALLALVSWQFGETTLALFAVALFGATVGFLHYNAHPAKLFMGDGGSYFLGFNLAAISTLTCMDSPFLTQAALPYLILAVPILDMIWVILGRLWARTSPFYPDQRHLHHRLLNAGLSHGQAVTVVHYLMVWVGSWAIVLINSFYGWMMLLVSTIALGNTLLSLWNSRSMQLENVNLSSVDS